MEPWRVTYSGVSTHAPVKARPNAVDQATQRLAGFNPRACEGATLSEPGHPCWPWCFNPRACEGATRIMGEKITQHCVSTHAPVKARPGRQRGRHQRARVSTHAPVKARPWRGRLWPAGHRVSTHAPVKARPSAKASPAGAAGCFNPRACEGATPLIAPCKRCAALFQPTRL